VRGRPRNPVARAAVERRHKARPRVAQLAGPAGRNGPRRDLLRRDDLAPCRAQSLARDEVGRIVIRRPIIRLHAGVDIIP